MSAHPEAARPVAVITGGSSNIGWACVRRFAATHEVLIADLKPHIPGYCRVNRIMLDNMPPDTAARALAARRPRPPSQASQATVSTAATNMRM